jgi:uncharacterized membrane protein YcaP (DUF421 family)
MESIVRSLAVYAVLLLIFRIAGKRSLAQITTFDFVLLLIIGEAVQEALLGRDYSLTNALIIVVTLIGVDIGLSLLKQRSKRVEQVVDGVPVVILADGKPIQERMDKERVDEADILVAARTAHGLERLDQIKYAVLEQSGGISIIPKEAKA